LDIGTLDEAYRKSSGTSITSAVHLTCTVICIRLMRICYETYTRSVIVKLYNNLLSIKYLFNNVKRELLDQ